MRAPDIDKRSYDDIVAQTEVLAQRLSGWRPPRADERPDAGHALIRIFAGFAELVIERLNRAPDTNFLAFLNLIGASQVPPRPARVPLTFSLAAESPVDALVPAGTLAAAPAQSADTDEVVYETERSLVVTRAQLEAIYVSDPTADTFSDRSARAAGKADGPFGVFHGDTPSPHQLFLACAPLLTQPGVKDVTLTLTTPDTWQWRDWPVSWALRDGDEWRTVPVTVEAGEGSWRVTLSSLPELTPHIVGAVEAGWLRAELGLPLPHEAAGLAPDSVASGTGRPQQPAFPLALFPADAGAQQFLLCADRVFGAGGARATVAVTLATPGVGADVRLSWSYYIGGDEWEPLAEPDASFSDGTQAFTTSGEISFRVPREWPVELYSNRSGRWLRAQVTAGQYTTRPVAAAIITGYGWELPHLGRVTVACKPSAADGPQPPSAAFCNTSPIDLSKDFYPLGEQPVFNDTFFVACPDTLAWPGATVMLSATLANPEGSPEVPGAPPPVNTSGDAKLVWEVCDGTLWHKLEDAEYDLTDDGSVKVVMPAPLARTTVNGDEGYWLRARLVSGSYGDPASYEPDGNGGFRPVAATLAPPVIRTLSFAPADGDQVQAPVTACLTYNNFTYIDETTAATAPQGPPFTPFVPAADAEPALYLGFDKPPGERPVTLFLAVEPPLPEQVAAEEFTGSSPAAPPRLAWDYTGAQGWEPLRAADETQALSRQGLVTFIGPQDMAERSCFGEVLSWLRLRWQGGEFPLPPQLRRVLPGTTWAAQVTTIANETLGSGNGDPGQAFFTARTPVQPGQQILVGETQLPPPLEEQPVVLQDEAGAVTETVSEEGQPEQTWMAWNAVPDFYESGPLDRHYTVDPLSGEIRFGDGTHGLTPPAAQNNIRITYRTGGGEQGNRPAGAIVELKSSVPSIEGVTNHEPAQGGSAAEPLDRLQARGPHLLRHRGRAIAAQDLEDLAAAASADVARAAAIVPIFNPYSLWLDPEKPKPTPDHEAVHAGRMGVVIVPGDSSVARPAPGLGLLRDVEEYLSSRCPPTADLWVAGPEWIAVDVTARVAVTAAEDADPVRDRVIAALSRFLHPLTGGPRGDGWPFGRWPRASAVSALIEATEGVDHVIFLNVSYQPDTEDEQLKLDLLRILTWPLGAPDPPAAKPDVWHWLDRALSYCGKRGVSVELAPADNQAEAAGADPSA